MEGAHQSTVLALTAAAMGASLLRARPAAGQQSGGSRAGRVCLPVHTRGQAREERGSAEDLRFRLLSFRISNPWRREVVETWRDFGKGQMGSALMGSLQISCFLTEGFFWYSR